MRRLKLLGASITIALVASGCGSAGDGGDASDTAEAVAPTATVDTAAEPTQAPVPTPLPTSTAIPEPSPAPDPAPADAVVDIAAFEPFPLPDYVTEQLGEGFSSYFIEVEPGVRVHVLEVGTGYPVYLQHGAPTSGLLYRKLAAELPPDEFRLIMPTMVGLGFSGGVDPAEHTLDNHARWMQLTLNELGLDELIYVGHDWGGPIGMGAMARTPDLLAGAVLLNTSLTAPTEPVELNPALATLLSQPAGSEAALNVAIFAQLPAAQSSVDSMPPEVLDLYRRPVVEGENVTGPVAILGMAADGPDHPTAVVLREIESFIAELEVPAEIVWGTEDPLLGAALDRMIMQFPDARVTRTEAGHFLQEEAGVPADIAAAIQRVRADIGQ